MTETIARLLEKRKENREAFHSGRCTYAEYSKTELGLVGEVFEAVDQLTLGLSGVEEALARLSLTDALLYGGSYEVIH